MEITVMCTDDICPKHIKDEWKYWEWLKKKHPDLAIYCFVVVDWKGKKEEDISGNKIFEKWYRDNEDWITIGMHSLYHDFPPDCLRSKEEQREIIEKQLEVWKDFLPYHWGYRPPGFYFNSHTVEILKELGCTILFLRNDVYNIKDCQIMDRVRLINTHTNSSDRNPDDIRYVYKKLDREIACLK